MIALLDAYLAVRRSVGFKLVTSGSRLRRFAEFVEAKGETHVRTDTAVEWAGTAASPHERNVRLQEIAIFARHLRAEDPGHEIPSPHVFAFKRHKRLPYIYADDDVLRLLELAGRQHNRQDGSFGDTFEVFLGLIAATGMRVREAINLQIRDFADGTVVVRNTKFRKSRRLPLHASTAKKLTTYCEKWRVVAGADEPLFATKKGRKLGYITVHVRFRRMATELGLHDVPREPDRMPGPRIHDLRHTFAVRSLEACPSGRAAINKHMLALSTYMGHCSVANTFWYLHATPHLMADIADACEAWLVGGAR